MDRPRLTQTYSSPQGDVAYEVVGSGPDVVLIHGTPWSSYTWHALIPALAQSHRVHYFDLIGYGQSEKRSAQRVSLDVQGELLAALIEHWGLQKPSVIAHDFGGATALRAHLLGGCEFSQLMLINVVAMAPWGSEFFTHVQAHEQAFAGVPAYIHEAIVERYIQGALYKDSGRQVLKALVYPWLGEAGQAAFYRQIAQAHQRYTDDVQDKYAHIRCPVTIVWGEQDAWIPLKTGQRLHESIPHSRFIPVPNAGHLAQLDAPETVVKLANDFLRV